MSKKVWILPVLFIAFILMLIVGGIALAETNKVETVDVEFFVFPYYEGKFNPTDLKSWKQIKIVKCPQGGDDLYVEFKNPETNEVIFGKFWVIESEHFLVEYWYESLFYDYYFVYDGDESYRFFRKEITDESEQNIQRR